MIINYSSQILGNEERPLKALGKGTGYLEQVIIFVVFFLCSSKFSKS